MFGLKTWFTTKPSAFESGYRWAVGELDKGVSVEEIETRADGAFDGPHPFDKGALKATLEFSARHNGVRELLTGETHGSD